MNNEPVAWMSPDGKVSDTEGKLFYIPLYTHPVKEQEIEKLIGDLRNVAKAQGQKGCWDFDQYMLGLFNGLELALSIFEKREPQYREFPPHPVKEHFEDEPQAEELHEILQSNAELTDEEILQVMINVYSDTVPPIRGVEFARAILRKAQEK